jgi:regulator of CtrA degradation
MTDMTPQTVTTVSLSPTVADRIFTFAKSSMFERTFRDGMSLVEETAAYLDGPGRAASKRLPRIAALSYAAESMRLTTRLMQVASWLLVQRAVREGEMDVHEAASDRYRLTVRPDAPPLGLGAMSDLPEGLLGLIERGDALYERVQRLDEDMYAGAEDANPVFDQVARLRAAFGKSQ